MRELRCGNQQPGAGITGNVLDLPDVQPGLHRYRAEARGPAGEHQIQELGAVLHTEYDPIAGREAAAQQAAREARNAAGEFAIGPGVIIGR